MLSVTEKLKLDACGTTDTSRVGEKKRERYDEGMTGKIKGPS